MEASGIDLASHPLISQLLQRIDTLEKRVEELQNEIRITKKRKKLKGKEYDEVSEPQAHLIENMENMEIPDIPALFSNPESQTQHEKSKSNNSNQKSPEPAPGSSKSPLQIPALDISPSTYCVPKEIRKHLKPHQLDGVMFLYDRVARKGQGSVLADYMGLGKTVQAVSFCIMYLSEQKTAKLLIVAPAVVCTHWLKECDRVEGWLRDQEIPCNIPKFILGRESGQSERRDEIATTWSKSGGLLVISYELLRRFLSDPNSICGNALAAADVLILDEGHRLRNAEASTTRALRKIETPKRLVLTGYPLQNNLFEYWTMIDFVAPGHLHTFAEFKMRYANDIHRGQQPNAGMLRREVARRRSWLLFEKVSPVVLRRDMSVLEKELPPKTEVVITIRLSPMQENLYRSFLESVRTSDQPSSIFWAFSVLTLLCNHPDILKSYSDRLQQTASGGNTQLQTTPSKQPPTISCGGGGGEGESSQGGPPQLSSFSGFSPSLSPFSSMECPFPPDLNALDECDATEKDETTLEIATSTTATTTTSTSPQNDSFVLDQLQHRADGDAESFDQASAAALMSGVSSAIGKGYTTGVLTHSGKAIVLLRLLNQAKMVGERTVVFSRSLRTLDFLEATITSVGLKVVRFDGSTSGQDRQSRIDAFNDPSSDLNVFLISTKAGNEGISLVGANRVVLFDVNWNPSIDRQACCRVFRFGQTRPVYIYRLVTEGTIEEKVYERQVNKEVLSKWVVDDQSSPMYSGEDTLAATASYLLSPPTISPHDHILDIHPILLERREDQDPALSSLIDDPECKRWLIRLHAHDHLFTEDPTLSEMSPVEKQKARNELEWLTVHRGSSSSSSSQNPVMSAAMTYSSQEDVARSGKSAKKIPQKKDVFRPSSNIQQPSLGPSPIPMNPGDELKSPSVQFVGNFGFFSSSTVFGALQQQEESATVGGSQDHPINLEVQMHETSSPAFSSPPPHSRSTETFSPSPSVLTPSPLSSSFQQQPGSAEKKMVKRKLGGEEPSSSSGGGATSPESTQQSKSAVSVALEKEKEKSAEKRAQLAKKRQKKESTDGSSPLSDFGPTVVANRPKKGSTPSPLPTPSPNRDSSFGFRQPPPPPSGPFPYPPHSFNQPPPHSQRDPSRVAPQAPMFVLDSDSPLPAQVQAPRTSQHLKPMDRSKNRWGDHPAPSNKKS